MTVRVTCEWRCRELLVVRARGAPTQLEAHDLQLTRHPYVFTCFGLFPTDFQGKKETACSLELDQVGKSHFGTTITLVISVTEKWHFNNDLMYLLHLVNYIMPTSN